MAHAYLGHAYGEIGESDLAAETAGRAYLSRDRASDSEKFFIALSYDFRVTGNLEKAQQTCEAWAQTYPRDANPHGFLNTIYRVTGKYETSVEEGKKAIVLDPDFALAYSLLADSYQYLNRLGEAGKTLQRASERKLEIPFFMNQRYDLAFLKGDKAEMEREAALAEGKRGSEDLIDHEALVLAYYGHLQQARRMS